MACPRCDAAPLNPEARFCSKCGNPLPVRRTGIGKAASLAHWLAAPFVLIGRVLAYPIKLRQERIRWLTKASGPDSPINDVPRLSDGAKRVYAYLASVTLHYGSSHSRVRTIARVAGMSEHKARELERRGLLSHRKRNTWHGRGAHDYHVKPVDQVFR